MKPESASTTAELGSIEPWPHANGTSIPRKIFSSEKSTYKASNVMFRRSVGAASITSIAVSRSRVDERTNGLAPPKIEYVLPSSPVNSG